MLVPKLVTILRTYDRRQLQDDLTAGMVVGIVAIPLAIAFAIASGVTPERGLYTAVVAGFLISALGGSRVQIGGPTGAFVVIVLGIVQEHGVDGLAVATIMAGAILTILGLARFGAAIKFIPFAVTCGFTSGIAVIIFSGQVGDLLGLRLDSLPGDFFQRWVVYGRNLGAIQPAAVLVSAATLAIVTLWPRLGVRVPGPFVAMLATTAAVHALGLPVETIGSRFGEIATGLPVPHLPSVGLEEMRHLVGPAFTIAMLAAIESLLSAMVADGMIGSRHRSNMELVAQGIANLVTPLFGGIPATGAIARTATNVRNGGRTPVAGIAHAATVLLVTLFFGRWVALVPMATLAGILVVVAYHMSEWRSFRAELRAPRSDVTVLLVTFALTVLVDLTVAIEVGMVLAAFLFMRRMAEVTNVSMVTREFGEDREESGEEPARGRPALPRQVAVYEIDGPFFFGAAEKFRDTLESLGQNPRVLVIRMRAVPAIDSTGLHVLRELARRFRASGGLLVLADVHSQPLIALERSGLLAELGPENVCGALDEALGRARSHLASPGEGPV